MCQNHDFCYLKLIHRPFRVDGSEPSLTVYRACAQKLPLLLPFLLSPFAFFPFCLFSLSPFALVPERYRVNNVIDIAASPTPGKHIQKFNYPYAETLRSSCKSNLCKVAVNMLPLTTDQPRRSTQPGSWKAQPLKGEKS